jgi:hypothetical protein
MLVIQKRLDQNIIQFVVYNSILMLFNVVVVVAF